MPLIGKYYKALIHEFLVDIVSVTLDPICEEEFHHANFTRNLTIMQN